MADQRMTFDEVLFMTNPLRLSDKLTVEDFRAAAQAEAEQQERRERVLAYSMHEMVQVLCKAKEAGTGLAADPLMVTLLHLMAHQWLEGALEADGALGRALVGLRAAIDAEADSEGSQG